jgi:hypothetical protein
MNRQSVKSSNLKSIGYDEFKKIVEVEFLTGDVYQYADVPETVYIAVMTAPSIGSAVYKMLRGKFEYKKVGG